jgi:hypothetical protein
MKRFKLVFFRFLTAIVVCTLLGYAVLAQPVRAGAAEPTVKSSVKLRVEFPDAWPWSQRDGPGAWTLSLWEDPGS